MIFWFFWQIAQIILPLVLYFASIWYGAHLLSWLFKRLSWYLGWHANHDLVTGKVHASKRFWRWANKHLKPQLDEIFGPEIERKNMVMPNHDGVGDCRRGPPEEFVSPPGTKRPKTGGIEVFEADDDEPPIEFSRLPATIAAATNQTSRTNTGNLFWLALIVVVIVAGLFCKYKGWLS